MFKEMLKSKPVIGLATGLALAGADMQTKSVEAQINFEKKVQCDIADGLRRTTHVETLLPEQYIHVGLEHPLLFIRHTGTEVYVYRTPNPSEPEEIEDVFMYSVPSAEVDILQKGIYVERGPITHVDSAGVRSDTDIDAINNTNTFEVRVDIECTNRPPE
jgi:hypothetical protein